MAMLDFLRRLNGTAMTYRGQELTYGPSLIHDEVLGMEPAEIWRTQPHLRTVVTFIARNIAQLGLHTFQRAGEDDRARVRTGPLAETLARPNAFTTTYELVFGLVADMALYDVAYLHLVVDVDAPGGWGLYRLPPDWVTPQGGDAFGYKRYVVQVNGGVARVTLDAASVIDFHGWSPADARYGSSPVGALKGILAEQMMAVRYRQQVWQNGGRVSTVLTRPAGAQWSPEARESFRADWRAKFTGEGAAAGGTPILEDGMTINRLDFNAHEQQFVEAARLALGTVAGVFHINPTMLGDNTGANYSNVREFRKMLYGDSLGPLISQLEDRLNTFLVPLVEPAPGLYVEFNIAEKLQGNFEEQAAALSTSVGAPYMLRSEARARMNLPAIPDADTLVVPLNVLVGGQPSPQTLLPGKAPRSTRAVKARAAEPYQTKYADVVRSFFARQAAAVRTRLGLKAAGVDWWDSERWDSELSRDLFALATLVTGEVAASTLDGIGFSPDAFNADQTLAWLREVSDRSAAAINDTTKAAITAALAEDDPPAAVAAVFDGQPVRADGIAQTGVTLLSGFAVVEAAKQVAGDVATKSWVVTSARPRASHAALNGQTVPLSENFSNGMAWPGDSAGGADEVAGCSCSLDITIP